MSEKYKMGDVVLAEGNEWKGVVLGRGMTKEYLVAYYCGVWDIGNFNGSELKPYREPLKAEFEAYMEYNVVNNSYEILRNPNVPTFGVISHKRFKFIIEEIIGEA